MSGESGKPSESTLDSTRQSKGHAFLPGALVVDGRFRILELVGQGGMGEVYLAEQLSLQRRVAIKVLREDLVAQPGMAERFRREALLLSTVDHPAVVRVFDFGQWQGASYLVMEYVEGRTLAEAAREGPFSVERALPLLRQIAEGLEAIHKKDIVHRDLKLENVLLAATERGEQARLLDFGIARLVESEGAASVTQAGLVIGTPESISPEQALGRPADARSDVYAFGVLAFRLLSGRAPFGGPTPREYFLQHVGTPPPPLIAESGALAGAPELCRLVMAALEKEPAERPQGGAALVAALTQLTAGGGAPTGSSAVTQGLDGVRRKLVELAPKVKEVGAGLGRLPRRARLGAATAVGLALVALGTWAAFSRDSAASRARALLEERRPADALLVLDKASASGNPARLQLRAAALHQLKRHAEEWRLIAPRGAGGAEELEPLALRGLCEDFAEDSDEEGLRGALDAAAARSSSALVEVARGPLSPAQWGALRYLDLSQRGGLELVEPYVTALASSECQVVATAARRLGELGDSRAIEPLEEVSRRPRKRVLIFASDCGQDAAIAAVKALTSEKGR